MCAPQVIPAVHRTSEEEAVYESLILLDPETQITTDQLAAELQRFYKDKPGSPAELAVAGEGLSLKWPGYTLEIGRSALPHVLEESVELAAEFGEERPDQARIAQCHTRFEVSGDDDPDMEHFNDYLFVGEAVLRLGRAYRFDQAAGEFLE